MLAGSGCRLQKPAWTERSAWSVTSMVRSNLRTGWLCGGGGRFRPSTASHPRPWLARVNSPSAKRFRSTGQCRSSTPEVAAASGPSSRLTTRPRSAGSSTHRGRPRRTARTSSTPDDPALHLDKFPARGRESPNWADQRLTDRVYDVAKNFGECLPDMDGILRRSDDLRLHPRSLPSDVLDIWASVPGRPSDWCHPSVDKRERRPRAERILARPAATHDEWLEALLAVGTVETSIAAVCILERLQDNDLTRRTPVVLTADGSWVPADPQQVFLLDEPREMHGLRIVAPEVAASPEARRALEALGIRTLDALGELDALLVSPLREWEATKWRTFWRLTRRVPVDSCLDLLRQRGVVHEIQAQTRGRGFRRVLATLLPGDIVAADETGDDSATIDVQEHAQDVDLLRALGAVQAPHGGCDVTPERWFPAYREAQRDAYLAQMTGSGPRPVRELLVFDQREAVGPLGVLPALSAAARARFTHAALAQTGVQSSWSMRHRTQTYYSVVNVINPTVWMLRKYGAVETSFGVRAFHEAYGAALS